MAKKETKAKSAKVGAVKAPEKEEKKAKKGEVEEVTVTKDYLEAHPELEAEGVSVGDVIEVPVAPKETSPKLKMSGAVAILKGEEFVRVYPEGSEEQVKSFLSKDGKYVAIDPEKIASVTVSWRENVMKKDEETGRMVDTGRLKAMSEVFTEKNGENWLKKARELANAAPRRSCIARLK